MDARLALVNSAGDPPRYDIVIEDGDLVSDDSLFTAIVVSLFSNARDDESDNPAGYWADNISALPKDRWGSLLKRLARAKDTDDARQLAREYAEQSLQWMLDTHVASSVVVAVSVPARDVLRWDISIDGVEHSIDYPLLRTI